MQTNALRRGTNRADSGKANEREEQSGDTGGGGFRTEPYGYNYGPQGASWGGRSTFAPSFGYNYGPRGASWGHW